MSAKTRIVVLHMKKLVFAGVITGLGVLLVIFLGILLGSSHKQSADNEAVETMYPLVRPTLDELAKQIISSQSLTDLTYSKNNQYTCRLLIGAVSEALEKASPDR